MSGTRPPSARLIWRMASRTYPRRSLEAANAREVGFAPQWILDRRTFTANEIEADAHRFERQQQVREENGGVDFDPPDGLKRDFSREIGRAAQIEKRVTFPQRAVLAHVPPGLSHEPYRSRVNWLAPAGLQKTTARVVQFVTLSRLRASVTRSSSQSGLNRSSAPSSRNSDEIASSRK